MRCAGLLMSGQESSKRSFWRSGTVQRSTFWGRGGQPLLQYERVETMQSRIVPCDHRKLGWGGSGSPSL